VIVVGPYAECRSDFNMRKPIDWTIL